MTEINFKFRSKIYIKNKIKRQTRFTKYFFGGNFPRGNFSGRQLSDVQFSESVFPGGKFPREEGGNFPEGVFPGAFFLEPFYFYFRAKFLKETF